MSLFDSVGAAYSDPDAAEHTGAAVVKRMKKIIRAGRRGNSRLT